MGTAISPRPGRFIVELEASPPPNTPRDLAAALGLVHKGSPSRLAVDFHYFTGPPSGDDLDLLERIRNFPGVSSAELDWRTLVPLVEGPQAFEEPAQEEPALDFKDLSDAAIRQAAYERLRQTIGLTGAPLLENVDLVPLAILDTGIELKHPALSFTPDDTHFNSAQYLVEPQEKYDASESSNAHGTAVAGIAAGQPTIDEPFAGVASGAPVMPLKLPLTPSHWDFVVALNWAVSHGTKVVNMSFHVAGTDDAQKAVQDAADLGVVLCAAAGNHYRSTVKKEVVFPAGHPQVIGVGAINSCRYRQIPVPGREGLMWGSRYGTGLDVMAPGTFCWTTDLSGIDGYNPGGMEVSPFIGDVEGHFTVFHGTSAAAPQVSGLAVLLTSHLPELSAVQIRSAIEGSCQKIAGYPFGENADHPNGSWHEEVGYGLIDVEKAFELAEEMLD